MDRTFTPKSRCLYASPKGAQLAELADRRRRILMVGARVLRVFNACQQSLESSKPVSLGTPDPALPLRRKRRRSAVILPPVLCEGAKIGSGTKIWHFSDVMKGATVGNDCSFGQNTHVAEGVIVGHNVKVDNNVSLSAGTVVESDVCLGPSCVFTNVTNPRS